MKMDRISSSKIMSLLKKYKYILIVLAVGCLLLLWPDGKTQTSASHGVDTQTFDVEALEHRMEQVLSKISGVGDVTVLLTVKNSGEKTFASDVEYREENGEVEENVKTVVISTGSGTEEVVVSIQTNPVFLGALVVCDGGDDPQVRLLITKAVAALTGLGTDKIAVCG